MYSGTLAHTFTGHYEEEVTMQHLKNVKELKQVLDVSVSLFEDAYFDSKDTGYATMMGLFASIVEQCQALLMLLENNKFTSTQSIARNILENYVDIKNIELEGNYVNYLGLNIIIVKKNIPRKSHCKNNIVNDVTNTIHFIARTKSFDV